MLSAAEGRAWTSRGSQVLEAEKKLIDQAGLDCERFDVEVH